MPKISEPTKNSIRLDYSTGLFSLNQLSLKYLVSKASVYFIVRPEKLSEMVKNRPPKTREQNTKHVKNYRAKLRAKKASKKQ